MANAFKEHGHMTSFNPHYSPMSGVLAREETDTETVSNLPKVTQLLFLKGFLVQFNISLALQLDVLWAGLGASLRKAQEWRGQKTAFILSPP